VSKYSKFLNSKERAEDVVQEAYTAALHYWPAAPSNPTEFSKWFATILGNCLKANHRDEITKGTTNREENDSTEEGMEGAAIPSIIFKQVVSRMNSKSEGPARILHLALVQQDRPAEIAAVTGQSEEAIRQTVSRFRKEIREEFGWEI